VGKLGLLQKVVLTVVLHETYLGLQREDVRYGYDPRFKDGTLYLNPWVLVDGKEINFFAYADQDGKIWGVTEIAKELEEKVNSFLHDPNSRQELRSLLGDDERIIIEYNYGGREECTK